ncbi:MAG: hypothetical protein QOH00_301 [Gaiellales bacterium]|nr:hypothetical protein [Gaiellales bacterium]
MGKIYSEIDAKLGRWIGSQPMFFVATAPDVGGHVNASPKGPIESLCVVDPHTIAYLDQIGSGAETLAHLRQNGRICVMLCAFQEAPRIIRLHGRGEVLLPGSDGYDELHRRFDLAAIPGAEHATRAVIRVEVDRIADSCGYGVPLLAFEGQRPQAEAWVARMLAKGEAALPEYVATHNAESIDGIPAL